MGKIPVELKMIIAKNIRDCRLEKFPGRGGAKRCAEKFGVSPQQWSPWERGMRTPDETRILAIAKFFGVTVTYLREDHSGPRQKNLSDNDATHDAPAKPHNPPPMYAGPSLPPPPVRSENDDIYWLLAKFFSDVMGKGITVRFAPQDIDAIMNRLADELNRHGAVRPDAS